MFRLFRVWLGRFVLVTRLADSMSRCREQARGSGKDRTPALTWSNVETRTPPAKSPQSRTVGV